MYLIFHYKIFHGVLKELQSLALDMKVLTENKEELAIKDLIESDIDDMPFVRERETREEVVLNNIDSDEAIDATYEDNDVVDIDDEFNFDSNSMFEDDDDEIDTTIPDGDMFEDDFEDDFGDEE